MAAMKTPVLSRWLLGAALAAASVALPSTDTKAERRLVVGGSSSKVGCAPNGTSNYYMEAYGYAFPDPAKKCEVFTQGGTSMATCAAFQHRSAITIRNSSNLAFISNPAPASPTQFFWNQPSQSVRYDAPNVPTCAGGATLWAQSAGIDNASNGI
jgi:hypothetical protein